MSQIADVRPSPIAGTWYSGDSARLRRQMLRFLDDAVLPALPGAVLGLIAPHAGHRYSGRTAGHAFAAVRGATPELVILVSPMHQPAPGTVLTTAHKAYATPLGEVPVDGEALEQLAGRMEDQSLPFSAVAYDGEHALEIELPFLQTALGAPFQLLPIMLRYTSAKLARQLGTALAEVARDRRALLVASTDLSHFYPLETARRLDGEMLRRMESLDPDAVLEAERSGAAYACGAPAVAAVMWAAKALGADSLQVLHYSTSADETGDEASVVGYGAAALIQTARE